MRMISGKKAAELSAMYPSSAFFSDPSIHMEYASWKKGEILVSAFDMPKYLIFLFSGTVKISAYRDDGSEFVLINTQQVFNMICGKRCCEFFCQLTCRHMSINLLFLTGELCSGM